MSLERPSVLSAVQVTRPAVAFRDRPVTLRDMNRASISPPKKDTPCRM
jgi:hypothetical protein